MWAIDAERASGLSLIRISGSNEDEAYVLGH
jgi:hypothetical protein